MGKGGHKERTALTHISNTYGKIKITQAIFANTKRHDIQQTKFSTDTQTAVLQIFPFAILATSHLHGLRTTGRESTSIYQKITLHKNLYSSSYCIAPVLNTTHYIFKQE